jgi:hypothetical protein
MRAILLVFLLAAFPAHADLYRWVDPQTGSVKFSTYPPPWFGQPALEIIEAYQAVRAELDRLDPAGAARRSQQEAGFIETLRRGLEAQLGTSFAPKPAARK